jgi:hypothetical protein
MIRSRTEEDGEIEDGGTQDGEWENGNDVNVLSTFILVPPS